MTVTVYIDVLFFINFLIGIILITGTAFILRFKVTILRLSIGSIIFSIYSCVMFFPYTYLLYTVVGRILFSILFIMLFFKKYKLIELAKAVGALFVISLIFSGFTYFIASILNDKANRLGSVISNGVPYFEIDIKVLLIAIVCAYGLSIFFIKLSDRNMSRNKIIFDAKVSFVDEMIDIKILCDTGCELVEPLSGIPVILISGSYNIDTLKIKNVRYVKINTASLADGEILPLIKPDIISLSSKEACIDINNCYIGFINKEFTKDGLYTAIANPSVFINIKNNQDNKYKEVILKNDNEIKEETKNFKNGTKDENIISKAIKLWELHR